MPTPPDDSTAAVIRAACLALGIDRSLCVACCCNPAAKRALTFKRPPAELIASDPDVPDLYVVVNPGLWRGYNAEERIRLTKDALAAEVKIEKDSRGKPLRDELRRTVFQIVRPQQRKVVRWISGWLF